MLLEGISSKLRFAEPLGLVLLILLPLFDLLVLLRFLGSLDWHVGQCHLPRGT